tara:strand:- start:7545 stop:7796 length:252 start_codon:yes stop_codon:yes gene_type:complete
MSAAPFGPIGADQEQIRKIMAAAQAFEEAVLACQSVDGTVNAEARAKLSYLYDYEMLRVADCAVTLQHNGVFKRCLEALEAQS